jgi:hypothetical protein
MLAEKPREQERLSSEATFSDDRQSPEAGSTRLAAVQFFQPLT